LEQERQTKAVKGVSQKKRSLKGETDLKDFADLKKVKVIANEGGENR